MMPQVQTKYFPLRGGVNIATPPITVDSGYCLASLNFEPDIRGGYRRIRGYERFDGRPAPSDATYYVIELDDVTGIALNDVITNDAGATGTVIYISGNRLGLTKKTGTFSKDETIGTATIVDGESQEGFAEPDHDSALYAAQEEYREDIQEVPGEGPIRGVWTYKDRIYAFRDSGSLCKMFMSTTAGWVEVITPPLSANGKYRFVNATFTGSPDTRYMYGVDGVNPAFQFDGVTFTQISTGVQQDNPAFIEFYKNYLFLGFRQGSVINSALGDPLNFTALNGAAEIAAGSILTGLSATTGALIISTRRYTYGLYGDVSSEWQLQPISMDVGAYAYSLTPLGGQHLAMDDRGIIELRRVQAFGNFESATVSRNVQPLLDKVRDRLVDSTVIRRKNQIRFFFDDSTVMAGWDNGKFFEWMPLEFAHTMSCVSNEEDDSGKERIMMGGEDGYVYEMEKGNNFDGLEIESFIIPVFNHLGSPAFRKRFRRAVLELQAEREAGLTLNYDISYGDLDVANPIGKNFIAEGDGSWYDVSFYDQIRYDSRIISQPVVNLEGTGTNISLMLFHTSATTNPFTFSGCIIHFSVRRLQRA